MARNVELAEVDMPSSRHPYDKEWVNVCLLRIECVSRPL